MIDDTTIMNAKHALSKTTHFQKQRIQLARELASLVAAGVNPDSTVFKSMFSRFVHTKRQLEIQNNLNTGD